MPNPLSFTATWGWGRQRLQTIAPRDHAGHVLVDRHARVVQDHRHFRVACGERSRIAHLPGIDLAIKAQAIGPQQGIAGLEGGIPQQVPSRIAELRIGVPIDDVAHASYVAMGGMLLQKPLHRRVVQRREGHDRVWQAACIGHGLQPFGFGQGVLRPRAGVDVDDLGDVKSLCVGQVVVQSIGVGDRFDAAIDAIVGERRLQPGILNRALKVPQVHVCVDDREVQRHGVSTSSGRRRCRRWRRWRSCTPRSPASRSGRRLHALRPGARSGSWIACSLSDSAAAGPGSGS